MNNTTSSGAAARAAFYAELGKSEHVYKLLWDLLKDSGVEHNTSRLSVGSRWRATVKIKVGLLALADLDLFFFARLTQLPVKGWVSEANDSTVTLEVQYPAK